MPTSEFKTIPPLSAKLIEALDPLFPNRCPDPKWPDREVWFKAGQASVVDFLRLTKARQEEEAGQ